MQEPQKGCPWNSTIWRHGACPIFPQRAHVEGSGEGWLHTMHQIWGGGVRVRGRDLTRVVFGLITRVAASGLPIRVGIGPYEGEELGSWAPAHCGGCGALGVVRAW